MKYLLTGIIVLLAVAAVLLKYWDYVINPWTRDGQVRAQVIQIAARVSAPVVKLAVRDNQFVKAGDLLFEIDPRTYKASLVQAQAGLDNARNNYHALEKQVEAAQSQVEVAQASILQAQSGIKELDATIAKNPATRNLWRIFIWILAKIIPLPTELNSVTIVIVYLRP